MTIKSKLLVRQGRLTYAISRAICNGFHDEDEDNKNCIYYIYESHKKEYKIKIAKSPKVLETGLLKQKYDKIYAPEELIKLIDILLIDENYKKTSSEISYKYLREMIGMDSHHRNTKKIQNLLILIDNIVIEYVNNKNIPKNKKILNNMKFKRYSAEYEINEEIKSMTQNYFYADKVAFQRYYYSTYRGILYNKIVNGNKKDRDNSKIAVTQLMNNYQSLSYEDMKKNKNRHYERDIQKPIMKALEDIQKDNILFCAYYYEEDSPPLIEEKNKLYIQEQKDINDIRKEKIPPFLEWKYEKIIFIYK